MAAQPHSRAGRSRPVILTVMAAAVLAGAVGWLLAIQRPLPPRTLVMATGPEGGTYSEIGPLYREILARAGIELRLLPTAGAVENLARLRDARSGVSVGFVEGGTTTATDSPDLASLGSVFYEPLWLFHRGQSRGNRFEDMLGKRLSIGPDGSGTRRLALLLLALKGIDTLRFELLSLTPEEAGEKLARGEIDAAAMVTSWESSVVRRLLADPSVAVANFPRADAYVALHPYLSKQVLPAGVGDLARNLPPADVILLATTASLAVRRDLHPALQFLLLEAAAEVHARPGVFHRPGQFPAPQVTDLPLSEEARQYYKSGGAWHHQRLPFWLAVLGERLLLVLIPIAGVAYPLLRSLPNLYAWNMRRRIFGLYGELKLLETELADRAAGPDTGDLLARLENLESRANRLRVPGSFSPSLYTFKHHVELVRGRL